VTRLATEKFVPKFYENVTGCRKGGRGWGEIFYDHWVKPIWSAGRDQAKAKAMAVTHRTENVSFPTVKVLISVVNCRVVRVHGLVKLSNVSGPHQQTRTSGGRRGSGKCTLSFLNTGRL